MRRPLILLAAAALSLPGCADGGDEDKGSPTAPPAATAVDVSATEFAFDVPAEVTGGVVEMRFTNTGGSRTSSRSRGSRRARPKRM